MMIITAGLYCTLTLEYPFKLSTILSYFSNIVTFHIEMEGLEKRTEIDETQLRHIDCSSSLNAVTFLASVRLAINEITCQKCSKSSLN